VDLGVPLPGDSRSARCSPTARGLLPIRGSGPAPANVEDHLAPPMRSAPSPASSRCRRRNRPPSPARERSLRHSRNSWNFRGKSGTDAFRDPPSDAPDTQGCCATSPSPSATGTPRRRCLRSWDALSHKGAVGARTRRLGARADPFVRGLSCAIGASVRGIGRVGQGGTRVGSRRLTLDSKLTGQQGAAVGVPGALTPPGGVGQLVAGTQAAESGP
jgi:hypothetical protein